MKICHIRVRTVKNKNNIGAYDHIQYIITYYMSNNSNQYHLKTQYFLSKNNQKVVFCSQQIKYYIQMLEQKSFKSDSGGKKTQMSFFFLFLLFCLLFTLCNFVFNFFELNFLSYLRTCNHSTLLIYQSVPRKNVTLVYILRDNTSTQYLYNGNNRSYKKSTIFTKKLEKPVIQAICTCIIS